jgi:stage III sporulation protein AD
MEIVQITALGIIAAVLIVVIKAQRPEWALLASIAAGILIFSFIIGKLSAVLSMLDNYSKKINIDSIYITTLLKIIGIAYIAEFGSEICKDAGESAIASKIELAGKVIIVFLAVPIVVSLLELILRIIP